MKRSKIWIVGFLAALSVSALAGCGSKKKAVDTAAQAEATAVGAATEITETEKSAGAESATAEDSGKDEKGTRVIIDHAGNEVELPSEINRIAITTITPLPSVYCLFDGSAEKLVGISPSSMAAAENSLLADVIPGLADVPTGFMKGSEVNIEELLAMEPDVVFYRQGTVDEYEKLSAAGIPAVCFSTTQWGSDSIATFEAWVKLLGEVLDQEDKAAGIAEYGREVYDMIQERLESAENLEKPSVLWLYSYSDGVIATSGNKHFGEWWANATGAVNAAHESDGSKVEINMEQIYEWDPDKIYITNFVPYLAEDLYNNAIEGHDWSVVRAVQEGQVYKCPLGMYRWYPPSSDTPLMLLWLAKNNHSELFEDIDMEAEMKDYYQRFYDVELTEENIEKIFNPVREAAGA